MIKRDILLRPRAEEDLESIYDYSYEEFGLNRAVEYIHNLNNTFIKLANNPDLARKCDFIKPNLQTYQVSSHIIFFKVTKVRISIIRILHKSMDSPRHL